jgi:hypothetical protein
MDTVTNPAHGTKRRDDTPLRLTVRTAQDELALKPVKCPCILVRVNFCAQLSALQKALSVDKKAEIQVPELDRQGTGLAQRLEDGQFPHIFETPEDARYCLAKFGVWVNEVNFRSTCLACVDVQNPIIQPGLPNLRSPADF